MLATTMGSTGGGASICGATGAASARSRVLPTGICKGRNAALQQFQFGTPTLMHYTRWMAQNVSSFFLCNSGSAHIQDPQQSYENVQSMLCSLFCLHIRNCLSRVSFFLACSTPQIWTMLHVMSYFDLYKRQSVINIQGSLPYNMQED